MKFSFLALAVMLVAVPLHADDDVLPGTGFPASRYEVLWTKSPFAVATSETVTETSPDYMLVGIAKVDGISYASVIERQNQEHFLISSDKPTRGLTLTSISRNGADTFAMVQKDGQQITLKLEQAPVANPGMPPGSQPIVLGAPGGMTPQIPMPGGFTTPPSARPFPRFHRAPIHLPPPPNQQQFIPNPGQ